MRSKLLAQGATRTWALVFDKGDEVVEELTAFAKREGLGAAHLTAIGALREVTLGFFDPKRKEYRRIPVREQVEVLSLLGDVALDDSDEPRVHAHVVVGKSDGTAHGGHLMEAHVWPTLELILTEPPEHLRRRPDPESGLALIDLRAYAA
jgi:predicted DNA-binding protein with PD1-like motif